MRRQKQPDWNQEDYDLEQEFEDVAHLVRHFKSTTPQVPDDRDRALRQRARCRRANDLPVNWLFGSTLQLAMAAILLFAIGIMFVLSLPQATEDTRSRLYDGGPTSISKAPVVNLNDGKTDHSWVRLTFNVSNSGQIRNISILERCYKVKPDSCTDDTRIDQLAIQQIRSRRYSRSGPMEKIVFIPTRQQ